jgi:hypothetical protein
MSTLLDPPPAPARPRRSTDLLEEQDKQSLKAGLLLTLVFWPLLILLLALAFRHLGHGGPSVASAPAEPVFDIQLTPELSETQQPAPQPPPDRFVETNPDAPENTPDKTRNFAARNQQVAQEKPDPTGKSDTPQLDGKKEEEVTQIVSGQLNNPQQEPPPPPPMPELPPSPQMVAAQREQNPLPGVEKIEGESKEGVGTNEAESLENALPIPKRVEGQKDAPMMDSPGTPGQPRIDPRRPLPRPRVEKNVRPAILAQNRIGTANIGPIAIDARWSAYGEYLQKLIETVQVQWERIIDQSRVYPPSGSTVTVKFRLDAAEGAVTEIVHSESTAGTQAERACISAITARAPYGKWTEDMVAVLGQSQEMTFTFYYQ